MPLTESGITINIPDESYFRFQNCPAYRRLCGMNFKEMDVCYFDHPNKALYLIELKEYENASGNNNKRIFDLVKKSKDSLQMVNAYLQQTSYSIKNNSICFPEQFNTNYKKVFLSIINCAVNHNHYIHSVHKKYCQHFQAYAKLFDIDTYVVMTHEQAKKHYNWIT